MTTATPSSRGPTGWPGARRSLPLDGLIRDTEKERHRHPTQKPVEVMGKLISVFTKPGDLIVAPYMGSGPELVAARALGRRSIGIEIEERYCEETASRLSQRLLGLETA